MSRSVVIAVDAAVELDRWYAVEHARALGKASARAVRFRDRPWVIYRDRWGELWAVEDGCPRCGGSLAAARVHNDRLICPAPGCGDRHSMRDPRRLPVTERHGLVWVHFGDPARAHPASLPAMPELECRAPWAALTFDFVCHGRREAVMAAMAERARRDGLEPSDHPPYQRWSGERTRHLLCPLPLDDDTTRLFVLLALRPPRLARARLPIVERVAAPLLQKVGALYLAPRLRPDRLARASGISTQQDKIRGIR